MAFAHVLEEAADVAPSTFLLIWRSHLELAAYDAQASNPIRVPLTPEHWRIVDSTDSGDPKPSVEFARHEASPRAYSS